MMTHEREGNKTYKVYFNEKNADGSLYFEVEAENVEAATNRAFEKASKVVKSISAWRLEVEEEEAQ